MQCRPGCGACCIAISIHQSFYGMPAGKPAGVRCVHLNDSMLCDLFGDARRPALCDAFAAEREFCGDTREQALQLLAQLELQSTPDSTHHRSGSL
ncbi:MAG: YkgJ family cysteine cluster protein [Halioglobus sp.]